MNNPIQFGIIKKVNVDNRTVKIVCEQTSDIKKVKYIPTKAHGIGKKYAILIGYLLKSFFMGALYQIVRWIYRSLGTSLVPVCTN